MKYRTRIYYTEEQKAVMWVKVGNQLRSNLTLTVRSNTHYYN